VGWDRIVIESTSDESCNGRSIADIAAQRGEEPADTTISLLLRDPDTAVIGHAMHEDDVRTILADPDVMVASDASAMSPDGPLGRFPVHPRSYGTFPRVLGPYVRNGVLSLEAAVRKMTSLPADVFQLGGRGRIEAGAVADLVLFDPERVGDRADFGAPHAYPEGIDVVIVNGRVAWDGQRRERAGRVVRRSS
jgi:N-acyl-D-aspartate/D-glutamate deacylase